MVQMKDKYLGLSKDELDVLYIPHGSDERTPPSEWNQPL